MSFFGGPGTPSSLTIDNVEDGNEVVARLPSLQQLSQGLTLYKQNGSIVLYAGSNSNLVFRKNNLFYSRVGVARSRTKKPGSGNPD